MVIENIIVEVDIESWINNPAILSSGDILLIQGDTVIGNMRRSVSYQGAISVTPNDDATRAFFADDPGWVGNQIYGLKYWEVTGSPYITDDSEEERHKDTRIVDRMYFEFGICHPSFKNVEGFDSYHKRPKPRHHVPQKSRRRRSSNKIKKVK